MDPYEGCSFCCKSVYDCDCGEKKEKARKKMESLEFQLKICTEALEIAKLTLLTIEGPTAVTVLIEKALEGDKRNDV